MVTPTWLLKQEGFGGGSVARVTHDHVGGKNGHPSILVKRLFFTQLWSECFKGNVGEFTHVWDWSI